MLRPFIKRALVWLLLTVSFTGLLALNPIVESEHPTTITTDEPDFVQLFIEKLPEWPTIDFYQIKLDFYNATGLFSFLNSGDIWCPNPLLVWWCGDAL